MNKFEIGEIIKVRLNRTIIILLVFILVIIGGILLSFYSYNENPHLVLKEERINTQIKLITLKESELIRLKAALEFQKGELAEMQGDFPTALEHYTKAISLNPELQIAIEARKRVEGKMNSEGE